MAGLSVGRVIMNLYDLHPNPKEAPGYEKRFMVPEIAYKEALKRAWGKVGQERRSPDLEPAIAKDPMRAVLYARDVIREPFPEAEPVIAKSAFMSRLYAEYVLRGRFPLGEPTIASHFGEANRYESKFDLHRDHDWVALRQEKRTWPREWDLPE